MQRERLEVLAAERAGEQRIVAELRVGVEREVIGRQGDARVEQDLKAASERLVDRSYAGAPEEPVMDEKQPRPLGRRELEQLGVRRDAGGDGVDLGGPGDLQAVDAVVLETGGPEHPV